MVSGMSRRKALNDTALGTANWSSGKLKKQARPRCAPCRTHLNARGIPTCFSMTTWQRTPREPPKTKAELREMLTEAVRNTQPEPKRLPKAK